MGFVVYSSFFAILIPQIKSKYDDDDYQRMHLKSFKNEIKSNDHKENIFGSVCVC